MHCLQKQKIVVTANQTFIPQEINLIGLNRRINYYYNFDGAPLTKPSPFGGTRLSRAGLKGARIRSLKYLITPYGRAVKNGSSWIYEYNLTYHLGNVRVVIRKGANNLAELIQQKHYYPFGMEISNISLGTGTNKYLYNGKEIQDDFNLYWYDYGARFYDPQLGRWHSVDPLAEKYINQSPYHFSGNNPIRFIDFDGRSYGDFINEQGRIIGNDGIDDGKVYVVKTTQSSFESGAPSAGISKRDANATIKFIKDNSGNTVAFQNKSIAYDNSVEIEGSTSTRQAMVDIVNQDNGRGGTKDANNREYGGSINRDGTVTQATPGDVGNPLENSRVSITLTTTFSNQSTFHSHPSGTRAEGNRTGSWVQSPSNIDGDIQNSRTAVNYVFGRGSGNVYIYNNQGVIATMPQSRFVTPKR